MLVTEVAAIATAAKVEAEATTSLARQTDKQTNRPTRTSDRHTNLRREKIAQTNEHHWAQFVSCLLYLFFFTVPATTATALAVASP